jgi:hypothetical protein
VPRLNRWMSNCRYFLVEVLKCKSRDLLRGFCILG